MVDLSQPFEGFLDTSTDHWVLPAFDGVEAFIQPLNRSLLQHHLLPFRKSAHDLRH